MEKEEKIVCVCEREREREEEREKNKEIEYISNDLQTKIANHCQHEYAHMYEYINVCLYMLDA